MYAKVIKYELYTILTSNIPADNIVESDFVI